MKSFFKKIILTLVIGLFLVQPFKSEALWGMGDTTFDPSIFSQETIQTIGQVSQIVDMVQNTLKTFGLDVVIYKVSQKMSEKLNAKILNKSTGGGDGNDAKLFVENFGKYFQDITKQQIGTFTNALSASNNPFAQSISQGISNQTSGATPSGLNAFSLDTTLPSGVSWQDAAGDLSYAGTSGWDFYGALALPENSPLGSGIIAQDELASNIIAASETAKLELMSTGFKPAKEAPKDNAFGGLGGGSGSESFPNVNFGGKITNPKNINEEQSKQTVTESFDRLKNADTFGKIIFGTLIQAAQLGIQQGFSKQRADGGASKTLYGGPRDLNSSLAMTKSWLSAPQQIIDLRKELAIGLEKTKIEITSIEKTISSVQKPLTDKTTFVITNKDMGFVNQNANPNDPIKIFRGTVLSLEACIPGPDTGYEQRFQDYVTKQLKETQNKASRDNDAGTKNTVAMSRIRTEATQAVLESRLLMSNAFLSIPGATGMKAVLSDYYRTAKSFRSLADTLITKKVVLNSLLTIEAEALAEGNAASNPEGIPVNECPTKLLIPKNPTPGVTQRCSLVLTDKQWSSLTGPEKDQLYAALTPNLISDFPEYLTESAQRADLASQTTTASGDILVTLKPLPADDPETQENEKDDELKKRVMDQQWYTWERIVPEAKKQPIFARYSGLTQNISDSASAQKAQLTAESTEQQYLGLLDALDDCKRIRAEIQNNPNMSAYDETFISSLKSTQVKNSYKGPSILTAAENDVPFNDLNERLLPSSTSGNDDDNDPKMDYLQVPSLATTAQAVLLQDNQEKLFCRLSDYFLYYWAPKDLVGKPIGCNRGYPNPYPYIITASTGMKTKINSVPMKKPYWDIIVADNGMAGRDDYGYVDPSWYRTNNAEILFNVSDN